MYSRIFIDSFLLRVLASWRFFPLPVLPPKRVDRFSGLKTR